MVQIDLTTKSCPFCAETIQAAAVKCRFCGEFLNTTKARALQEKTDAADETDQVEEDKAEDGVLFAARPSIFALVPAIIKTAIILAVIVLAIKYPPEEMINGHFGIKIGILVLMKIAHYRVITCWVLGGIILLGLFIRAIYLKTIHYEITADRIEWSRGILNRKVDNIDMFRVMDLKLRRSIFDCILGIGKVTLVTSDKSDPEFAFEKLRHSRVLYDTIKCASLQADIRTGVVHLE
jgi:membrane protein YdbS with pleckstrin-like domain